MTQQMTGQNRVYDIKWDMSSVPKYTLVNMYTTYFEKQFELLEPYFLNIPVYMRGSCGIYMVLDNKDCIPNLHSKSIYFEPFVGPLHSTVLDKMEFNKFDENKTPTGLYVCKRFYGKYGDPDTTRMYYWNKDLNRFYKYNSNIDVWVPEGLKSPLNEFQVTEVSLVYN